MSMISAQCDELRQMAESVGLEVPQAATLMMEAADAIDRLDAENAKLREELDAAKYDLSLFSEKIVATSAENAKLRELVRGLVYATHPADRARLIADAAEFGIEVDR